MSRQVAAFDFDGTLAKGDSLIPFLLRLIGGRRVALTVLRYAPALGLIGIGRGNRDVTKEKFIAHVLRGQSIDHVHVIGKSFADDMIRTRLFPEVVTRARWHQEQGHEVVLVSASLDVYLQPLADALGFTAAICTKLDIETGTLHGLNNRAEEKVRRIDEWLSATGSATGSATESPATELWAYGNSEGDYAMLRRSDHPFWVSKSGSVTPYS